MGAPLFWHLQNSVPKRASYGTEYACRAQKGFLRYATRFQKPSVLKTGFWGTEATFGTGNALLRYATHLRKRGTASYCTGHILKGAKQPPATPDASSKALNSLLRYRTHLRKHETVDSADREQPTPIRAPLIIQLDHIPVRLRIWNMV